jgi:demethylmenaquinone methyltransferase / 2-methoxy-6-polyprenyl-1,4-benzoquinol methylase
MPRPGTLAPDTGSPPGTSHEAPRTLEKAPSKIAGMFDAIAGRYDFLNHLLSAGLDRRWRRLAINELQLSGVERVLDLCTGTADLALAAVDAIPRAAGVVGVDFSAAMLNVGREKLAGTSRGGAVTLVRGDATRVPLADDSVDAVTVAFGIRNVDNPVAAIVEMRRVIRPGGRIAILEFAIPTMPGIRQAYLWYFRYVLPRIGRIVSRHDAAYDYLPASVRAFATPDELVKILGQAGFGAIRAVPLTFGIVFLYTARAGR